mgnify:FL=1
MNCDKCKNYIYSNDWFPENDFKICKKCFEGSDKSAPNNKRFINHFDLDNSMSDIEDQMKSNVKNSAMLKAYHDLSDIHIEDVENPKRAELLHSMILELLDTSKLNNYDCIAVLKQATLFKIYNTVEDTIDKMEKNNIEAFQKEFK